MNSAGAPLPIIPRRVPSGSRTRSAPSSPPDSSAMPIKVVVQHSTPPLGAQDSDSSSSDSANHIRTKRVRAFKATEQSTPKPSRSTSSDNIATPSRRPPLIYTPGISLRQTTEKLKTRNFSESHASASSSSSVSPSSAPPTSNSCFVTSSQSQPRLIRKKSGQLVKSSLKSSKSLSVLTRPLGAANSKSAPATPTHTLKAVHFDAQLEHVKLFLAEQKPLAVSRDGSPTDDTSGTDTDFPSFIFGADDPPASVWARTRALIMHTPNMHPPMPGMDTDVVLEELRLAPGAAPRIEGRVRVRNLAYAKSVVARFTFDGWQTTSEVSAHYTESRGPAVDVFVFSIRLDDLLQRIEGKRMWLAVRYNVAGREVWDNNGGRDYLAEFSVTKREEVAHKVKRLVKRSGGEDAAESDIANLRSTLEKVVQAAPRSTSGGINNNALGTRYDFNASFKDIRTPPVKNQTEPPNRRPALPQLTINTNTASVPAPPRHTRTLSYPASTNATPRPASRIAAVPPVSTTTATAQKDSIARPEAPKAAPTPRVNPPLGSPRDAGDAHDAIPPRNHRRGYFGDLKDTSTVRCTPPGTPPIFVSGLPEDTTPVPGRAYSFPPAQGAPASSSVSGLGAGGVLVEEQPRGRAGARETPRHLYGFGYGYDGLGFSFPDADRDCASEHEQSTPSLSSSRDTSPSPTESCLYGEGEAVEGVAARSGGGDEDGVGQSPSTNYRQFLNKFCFFTGHLTPQPLPTHAHASSSDSSDSETQHTPLHTRAHTHPKGFIDIPRTQSASEIEELLSASPRAQTPTGPSPPAISAYVRTPSFDFGMVSSGSTGSTCGSGAATPQPASPRAGRHAVLL
ncbi:hypothetical protein H0H81_009072 [Sphagnurus paluster]|uniref:CBM21 domain-containing protein n=1 Tax=Sphagnurus paluster TaxID=117069 RepID=A0A9P7KMN1_9AGAR|nr:hypothetical protein H0H81_009072 [Sphagnurus paluster]